MDKHLNTAGYHLIDVVDDQWLLTAGSVPVAAGTFKEVIVKAIKLGFQQSELEFAVQAMCEQGHNAAHFGMFKGFIYTYQKEFEDDGRKAS